jgi:hypothetical protein
VGKKSCGWLAFYTFSPPRHSFNRILRLSNALNFLASETDIRKRAVERNPTENHFLGFIMCTMYTVYESMRYRKLRIIVCTRKLPLVHIVSILIGQEIWGKIELLVYMSYGDCSFPPSFVYSVKTEQSIRCKDRGFCTPSLSCPTKCTRFIPSA